MIATAIPAAIRPYSIAVAPDSFIRKTQYHWSLPAAIVHCGSLSRDLLQRSKGVTGNFIFLRAKHGCDFGPGAIKCDFTGAISDYLPRGARGKPHSDHVIARRRLRI